VLDFCHFEEKKERNQSRRKREKKATNQYNIDIIRLAEYIIAHGQHTARINFNFIEPTTCDSKRVVSPIVHLQINNYPHSWRYGLVINNKRPPHTYIYRSDTTTIIR